MKSLIYLLLLTFSFEVMANTGLSEDDPRSRLSEINQTNYILGGLVGSTLGFGVGHAIQGGGRYSDSGLLFTIGEGVSAGVFFGGYSLCSGNDVNLGECLLGVSLISVGITSFAVFKIWEIVEVWAGGASHNQRVEEYQKQQSLNVFLVPPSSQTPSVLGLSYKF